MKYMILFRDCIVYKDLNEIECKNKVYEFDRSHKDTKKNIEIIKYASVNNDKIFKYNY